MRAAGNWSESGTTFCRPSRRNLSSKAPMSDVGRILLVLGVVLALVGGGLMLFGRFHLPGDFTFRAGGLTVVIPIATSIVLSIVLTVLANLFFRQR